MKEENDFQWKKNFFSLYFWINTMALFNDKNV